MGESSISDVENQASAGDLSAQLRMARTLLEAGDLEASRTWLRRAAESGPAYIKLELADNLLTYIPSDVSEGIHWAREAAEAGSGEAAHRLAVLAAEGVGGEQSWSDALDHLRRAATLGHRMAQAELAGLSGDWSLAQALLGGDGDPPDGGRLGHGVDLASWLKVPAVQILLLSPRVVSVPGFLSPGECDWMIQRARPYLKRAQTFDPRTGLAQVQEGRNHSCVGFDVVRSDMVFALVRARMALVTGHSRMGFEDTSVLHYAPGEQFAPHYDFIEADTPAAQREIASSGQRAVTFLAYLNAGYEGGETAFPVLGRSFKGKKGHALFYDNALADGSPDRRTLHAGTPLKRGEKWLMSQWIRSRPGWLSQ
jgi:prolyl 4-hydroxylase